MTTNPKARLGCCPEGSCVDEAVIRAPLDAEIERLRAMLKPFAAMGAAALRTPGDCAFGTMSVPIGDLIRATHAPEQKAGEK